MQNIYVSVIVPVLDNALNLSKCLRFLENQTYPEDLYEVIVVDNGSKESLEQVVAEFPQAVLVKQPKKGSYAARNEGIRFSKGQVIGFTDSDCIPAIDWIETGLKKLKENRNCGLLAGKIELSFDDPGKLGLIELYEKFSAFKQEEYIKSFHFGATANMFTFREVFDKVGLFNEKLLSNGDREFGNRVYAAGYELKYSEYVRVSHPSRKTFKELRDKVVRTAKGHMELEMKKNGHTRGVTGRFFLVKMFQAFRDFVKVWSSGDLDTFTEKAKVFLMLIAVRFIALTERIRVLVGRKTS